MISDFGLSSGPAARRHVRRSAPGGENMGSATFEGRIDMGEKVVVNIKTFTDGHKPPDRVLGEGF